MGQTKLFIPQAVLDDWVSEGRAMLASDRLEFLELGKCFDLSPAVHFKRESTGAEDAFHLVGRVKEKSQLDDLGADSYMDSVIVEDNAFDVEEGFVAVCVSMDHDSQSCLDGAAVGSETQKKGNGDADELAELLLKHLK